MSSSLRHVFLRPSLTLNRWCTTEAASLRTGRCVVSSQLHPHLLLEETDHEDIVPQGGTRVRSFVHSPNLLPAGSAGTNYTGIISASDIFPTFCAIAGVALPSQASAPNQLDGTATSNV